jgi:Helix-turn-helix domain/RodZ C-terminal domain
MLEIGHSLRTARGRRGLELAQVDADTHIRMRYLKALEDERFDLIPGAAYVRGFLRTYSNYLGLEADLFIEEYNARFAPPEEPPPLLVPLRRPGRFRRPAAVAAVVAIALVPLIAWKIDSGSEPKRAPFAANLIVPTTHAAPAPARPKVFVPPKRDARNAKLILAATRGPCWLSVHVGSSTGRLLHEGTLAEGDSVRFVARRLWIRLGAPENLDAKLNGVFAALPGDTASVVVTTSGLRTVALG